MSIIIFGKGQSLLRCTKEFTDTFNEVVLINYPEIMENHMGNKADYHFSLSYGNGKNIGVDWNSEDIKKNYLENNLGIKKFFNIGNHNRSDHLKYYKDKSINFDLNFRRNYMNKNFDWFPPSGILAFDYFLKQKKYNKICLVGFDFYNFDKKCSNNNYYNNKMTGGLHTHTPKKQVEYLINVFKKNKNINFILYTNYDKFPKIPNLEIR